MTKRLFAAAAVLAVSAFPASAENIGVTVARADSTFLTLLRNGMEDHARTLSGVALQVEDAQNAPSRRLDQVQNFVASKVDAIIVAAVDGDSTPAMSKLAADAGIAIVYANHPPADVDSLPAKGAFVGSNEVDSGTLETVEVCRLLGGKGEVAVLIGPLNNHSSLVRSKDVEDVIATPDCRVMEIVDKQSANWDRLEAQNIVTNWLSSGMAVDAIVANNDEMAIGAIQALKAVGTDMGKIVVAGVDATPDALAAGDLDVTVFQNAKAQGGASVDAAVKMARGETVWKNIWVPFELVTPANMKDYQGKN